MPQTGRAADDDDDIAVKPVNPLVDFGLGATFVFLLYKLAEHLMGDIELAKMFGVCIIGTVFFSKATSKAVLEVGLIISRARRSEAIPLACRDPLRSKLQARKFADQGWQLAIHVSMSLYEVYLLRNETWYEQPATCFQPCPATYDSGENKFSYEVRLFYVLQLAIWVWTGFSCKWLETRRKDYLEMMLHHCLTIVLILFSFVHNELAIGLVILFVHDASDIVLDFMKMANYLKLEDAHGFYITEFFFAFNLATWSYLRMYIFPYHVAYLGTYIGYGDSCGPPEAVTAWDKCINQPTGSCSNVWALATLAVLHVYWFCLLFRILIKMLRGQKGHAAGASEYEGHDADKSGFTHKAGKDKDGKAE